MCIAIPGKIVKIIDDEAIVDYNGIKIKVNIMFIEKPNINEYVLIHAGCAIEKIDQINAEETLKIFKELSEIKEEG